jgi:DNA-binding transcriptional LysR family regulator
MSGQTPSLRDIDIRLLRIFCVVVESGGYTPAQEELNLAANTISTHMSNLESRMGIILCRRGRSGFALTNRGRLAYEATKLFMATFDNFNADIERLQEKMVGEVKIGVIDNLIANEQCRLHLALESIAIHAPEVRVAIQILSPNEIEHWLSSSKLHIALLPKLPITTEIQMDPIFTEYQELFCGVNHPLFSSNEADITSEVIKLQSYVKRGYLSALTSYSSPFAGLSTATAYHMEGLAYFILSGHFVGFLPREYAKHWVDQGQMRAIRPDLFHFEIPICIAYSKQNRLALPAEMAIENILRVHGR